MKLSSQPTAAATVEITGHEGTDLTLSTTTLTFTTSNWNIPQTVIVRAGPDDDAYDDTATLTHTANGGDYKDVTKELPVTVDDDETASLVVTPTEVGVIEENATGTSYTVRLSHVPIATTTVTVEGHAGTDLTLSGPIDDTLTFTPDNWDTAQTVRVTVAHDDDAVDEQVTLKHSAEGGAYEGLTKDIQVTVADDEETEVVLSPESLGPVAEGTDVSYTVSLSSEPTATTTVEITGHGDAPFSLDRSALTFTATSWDTPQTVTVTATQDPDAVDDEITLTHTANGGDYVNVTEELTVTVTDDEDTNVLVSRAELSVEEGNATGTSYTVKLSSEPTAAVTVEIGGHSGTDLRLSGVSTSSTLTFTASDWNSEQTVTVTAGDDPDAYNDTATLTHTASGGDYAGVTRDLPVTVDDDETASIVLSETTLVPEENATGATYTVRLSHVPTVTVTVGIGGHTGTDLTLSGLSASSTLTFTASNWNSPRTVTVTAAHDADAVNDRETLTHTAEGGEYGDVTRELPVTVNDDEETGVVLSPESLGPIAEGAGETYTVSLSSEPTATTTVGITGHGDAPLSLSGLSASSTLTFTASNWDTPQTVTVTADEDPDAVDDSVTLTHTANGGDYVDVTKELTVTVTDDEVTDLKLSATSLNPVEGAAGTTYTVRLTSEPTAAVTVEIGGHSGTDLRLSGVSPSSTLTFTASNWDTAQTVTVRANEDPDAADDTATLTHTASGGDYAGVTRDLPVTVDDDETASLVLSETTLVPEENATGTTYTVELSHVPTVTVTVRIGGHTGTDLALSATTLTFDSSNWNSPRTVTVTAAHDADAVNDVETLTHTAEGGEYGGVTRELPVTVDDDEETGVVLSPTSLGPIAEGTDVSYTVKLSSEPTATTTVGIGGHEDASIALSGLSASSTLTFTATNWDTPRTVTVTATQDPDAVDDSVTLTHTANGGDYVDVTEKLTVTVDDDEVTDLDLSATSLNPVEGNTGGTTYTVRLTSQPTAAVMVTIGGHADTDLALSGVSASSTLTFTTSNWNSEQTVTVRAGEDADAYNDTATLTHTANGGDYGGVTRELPVRVDDDETAAIVLSETLLEPVENATGATYTVQLSHVPTVTVTVGIGGHTGTDLTLSATTLTFTASNWNSPRTVTVTAAHDDDAVNDRETLTHTAEGGEYGDVKKDLPVTVDDDEVTGVVLSPTSLGPIAEGTDVSYTVKLSSEPTATTTVEITGHVGCPPLPVRAECIERADLHRHELGHPPDRDGDGGRGPRRGGRQCHPHTHRQRRGLPGRDEGACGHGDRRRGDRPEAVRYLAQPGRGRGRRHLHGEADERAHGRRHSHHNRTHRYGPHPVRPERQQHTDLHGLQLERGADSDRDRGR